MQKLNISTKITSLVLILLIVGLHSIIQAIIFVSHVRKTVHFVQIQRVFVSFASILLFMIRQATVATVKQVLILRTINAILARKIVQHVLTTPGFAIHATQLLV
jgi:hypothetical protein